MGPPASAGGVIAVDQLRSRRAARPPVPLLSVIDEPEFDMPPDDIEPLPLPMPVLLDEPMLPAVPAAAPPWVGAALVPMFDEFDEPLIPDDVLLLEPLPPVVVERVPEPEVPGAAPPCDGAALVPVALVAPVPVAASREELGVVEVRVDDDGAPLVAVGSAAALPVPLPVEPLPVCAKAMLAVIAAHAAEIKARRWICFFMMSDLHMLRIRSPRPKGLGATASAARKVWQRVCPRSRRGRFAYDKACAVRGM